MATSASGTVDATNFQTLVWDSVVSQQIIRITNAEPAGGAVLLVTYEKAGVPATSAMSLKPGDTCVVDTKTLHLQAAAPATSCMATWDLIWPYRVCCAAPPQKPPADDDESQG